MARYYPPENEFISVDIIYARNGRASRESKLNPLCLAILKKMLDAGRRMLGRVRRHPAPSIQHRASSVSVFASIYAVSALSVAF
jgi:hypothetical protein